MILQYAPLVRYVAGRVGVGLPASVEQGDLVSYGVFGLIDAIEKYDPERAIKFETYAINRIRGAIIDELRSFDWIPRSVRTKARDIERAIAVLEARLQRTPTEGEIADELGLDIPELRRVFDQVSFVHVAALDEMLGSADHGDGSTLGERLEDERTSAPGDALDDEETRQVLARVDPHPPRARADRGHLVLLRGPDPRGDRPRAGRDREPDLPAALQGHDGDAHPHRDLRRRLSRRRPSPRAQAG